jgi:hypothetical protein
MNPTSLKGIKLADPAAGITQIEPPTGNSTGLAALQFPLDTPPGRRGVQPALAIAYNSAGRNGWLGVGWDLHLSEIQVDTRFGVPKYNGSETYVLDGEMLTPIAPPSGAPVGGQYFARRVEGTFDWIQRLGNNAAEHTWVVADKNGLKAFYGEASASRLADPAPAHRNIFRWSLSRIRDAFGNELKVTYQTDAGTNPEAFVQLYPSSIEYTSNATTGLAAAYRVDFVRGGPSGSSCDRSDEIIDAEAIAEIQRKSGRTAGASVPERGIVMETVALPWPAAGRRPPVPRARCAAGDVLPAPRTQGASTAADTGPSADRR